MTICLPRFSGRRATSSAAQTAAPEEMPVTETLELADRLKAETKVDLAAVVVNRVLPELFTDREEELFERLRTARRPSPLGGVGGQGLAFA